MIGTFENILDRLDSILLKLNGEKLVVCYSGGHSSGLCAINAVKKYGKENVILLNHDINPSIEEPDIKRFKNEVAEYLGLEITYANHDSWDKATPVSVCVDAKAWKVDRGSILCTNRLKTEPFYRWLRENDPDKKNTYIYGFDTTKRELERAQRRAQRMGVEGFKTDFPLIRWNLAITSTKDIGIDPPLVYGKFKHANCTGCLKAGWLHWYIVYCERPDIWKEAVEGEDLIDYSIHRDFYLYEKEELFSKMKKLGIEGNEHINSNKFWSDTKKCLTKYESELDELEKMDETVCLDCTI